MPSKQITQIIKELSFEKKFILFGSLLLIVSAFMPWFEDMDAFRRGVIYLGVTGPLYLAGFLLIGMGVMNIMKIILDYGNKKIPFMPLKLADLCKITGAGAFFMLIFASSVFFHPDFGINISLKQSQFGMMVAFTGVTLVLFGAFMAGRNKRNLMTEFEEEVKSLAGKDLAGSVGVVSGVAGENGAIGAKVTSGAGKVLASSIDKVGGSKRIFGRFAKNSGFRSTEGRETEGTVPTMASSIKTLHEKLGSVASESNGLSDNVSVGADRVSGTMVVGVDNGEACVEENRGVSGGDGVYSGARISGKKEMSGNLGSVGGESVLGGASVANENGSVEGLAKGGCAKTEPAPYSGGPEAIKKFRERSARPDKTTLTPAGRGDAGTGGRIDPARAFSGGIGSRPVANGLNRGVNSGDSMSSNSGVPAYAGARNGAGGASDQALQISRHKDDGEFTRTARNPGALRRPTPQPFRIDL